MVGWRLGLNNAQIAELSDFAMQADKRVRSKLHMHQVADERDYTSKFTGKFSDLVEEESKTGLSAVSFVLNGSDEQLLGADAVLAITANNAIKIAYFEAKWPRLDSGYAKVDYLQKGASHFSNQLARQASLSNDVFKFEMFYCESALGAYPPGAYNMKQFGSSCVTHADAYKYSKEPQLQSGQVWTQSHFKNLINGDCYTIGEILNPFAKCINGKATKFSGNIVADIRSKGFDLPVRAVVLSNRDVDISTGATILPRGLN